MSLPRALLAVALAGPAVAPAFAGRYPVDVTARVTGEPLGDRTFSDAADVVVTHLAGGAGARVRLSSGRHACELSARLERGALALAPGQRCELAVDEPGVRGRVEARLRSGRATLEGDVLVLVATWELAGELAVGPGGRRVEVLGTAVEVPGAPSVPVRGTAETTARGARLDPRR